MADSPAKFSIRDTLDPGMMSTYMHNQRHALDYLVAKGHITINKTPVIRLNEHGLLCADGDEDVPEETLRQEPRLFQAGADAAVQEATPSSLLDSLLGAKPLKRMSTRESYSTVISIMDSLPISTHVAWRALGAELRATRAHERPKLALQESLQNACEEDDLDWRAFEFFKRACEDGPKFINIQQSLKTLYRLIGVQDEWFFCHKYAYGEAQLRDAEIADAIFLVLGILEHIQGPAFEESVGIYRRLREKCRHLENLLFKTRVAPKLRRFMELYIHRADGNDIKAEDDDERQANPQPKKKRRCAYI
ncbi:hypothetical protein HDV57DRAFT_513047 [Trichoderma longibrachiatum]|uniref:Uncharacterized protein n=1 Tax=Trichoderma longibrachiatum ATCC 18648 TaxID=983965 RepID=A0A2T4C8J6_TRILO|nr:hypothetical protein M440DRAFT_1331341 [Trichoderma longibrachiatum ATCC 18648]